MNEIRQGTGFMSLSKIETDEENMGLTGAKFDYWWKIYSFWVILIELGQNEKQIS